MGAWGGGGGEVGLNFGNLKFPLGTGSEFWSSAISFQGWGGGRNRKFPVRI